MHQRLSRYTLEDTNPKGFPLVLFFSSVVNAAGMVSMMAEKLQVHACVAGVRWGGYTHIFISFLVRCEKFAVIVSGSS